MKLNRVNSAIDRNERNKINENFDILERGYGKTAIDAQMAKEQSLLANEQAEHAIETSEEAKQKAESVQTQFNQVVIKGDSSIEAAQARVSSNDTVYDTLKARLDAENVQVTQKLILNEAKLKYTSNADAPLAIPTYDGSGQTVHPDVIYISNRFAGFRYWMVHTPYPFGNDDYENPSILCSHDGVSWVTPSGATNPIHVPDADKLAEGYHFSDGCLIYRTDLNRLECWYRWGVNDGTEQIFRKTTTDGVNWSEAELVRDTTGTQFMLSPSVIYEDNKYRMWFVGASGWLWLTESPAGLDGTWSEPIRVQHWAKGGGITPWHIHVTKSGGLYHIVVNGYKSNGDQNVRYLHYGTSADGLAFKDTELIMSPRTGQTAWDNQSLYRASLAVVNGVYKLYYSAYSTTNRFHIGLVEGDSMFALNGSKNINQDAKTTFHAVNVLSMDAIDAIVDSLRVKNLNVDNVVMTINGKLDATQLLLHRTGIGEGRLMPVSPDKFAITNKINENRIDFAVRHLDASSIKLNQSAVADENTSGGVVRWQGTTKKAQVHDGTEGFDGWCNLNTYIKTPPTSATATGVKGDYSVDTSYLYVCVATNTWRRITLSAW